MSPPPPKSRQKSHGTTFNGRPSQYIKEPIRVKAGDRVRFWVVDAGPTHPCHFHVVGEQFDTVYLDPMFPPRDKTALPRKSAQVLGDLLGESGDDLHDLVSAAIRRARGRVVVKRRRHDATCAQPDWQIIGRSVRFDVYRGSARSEAG